VTKQIDPTTPRSGRRLLLSRVGGKKGEIDPEAPADLKERSAFLRWLSPGRISAVYVWIVLIVVFSVWLPDVFPTVTTWRNIASSQAVVAIVAVGLLFSLSAGAFDLSVGYAVGTLSIVVATLLRGGMNPVVAVLITLVLAAGIGVVNGIVVVGLGVDSFIATLGTSSVLQAIGIWKSGNQEIVGLPHSFTQLALAQPLGVPAGVIYLVILGIIVHSVLEHTPIGRQLYAIGGGREAARLAGVPVRAYTFGALVATALFAGIAAVLLAATVASATPDVGPEYLLPAFAAAFLGATQIRPGRVNVLGTLIATYLLATGSTGLELAGAATWVPYLFDGAALILAVALSVAQGRYAGRRAVRTRAAVVAGGRE
jgi:ribose transport system permease protein